MNRYLRDSQFLTYSPDTDFREVALHVSTFLAKHNIEVNGIRHSLILFSASWFKYHPDKYIFGKPITVWECDIYETPGSHSIIPVEFIEFRTVSLVDQLSNISGHVLLVCPCIDF